MIKYQSLFHEVIIIVVALAVFFAVRKIVKDKKADIGSCGCKCADCPHSSSCNIF